MRFRGKPHLHVIDGKTDLEIGVFDAKGYLEVEEQKLADRMMKRFKPVPVKQKKAAVPKWKDVKDQ